MDTEWWDDEMMIDALQCDQQKPSNGRQTKFC